MIVTAIKTEKIVPHSSDLYTILDKYVNTLEEKSILAVTSKIVSICEGRVVKNDKSVDKRTLIHQEADKYLEDPHYYDKYHISLTVKNNLLIASSGIDESNGNGYYVLWPKDPQESAVKIWKYLKTKHHLTYIGVIITDSHTIPLRWGVTGVGLAWSGFKALKSYIDKPDLFDRPFKFENESIIDGLAGSAVAVMGEGDEQTPMAIIKDIPFVEFNQSPPTDEEINNMKISIEDDIYAPLLTAVPWKKKTV